MVYFDTSLSICAVDENQKNWYKDSQSSMICNNVVDSTRHYTNFKHADRCSHDTDVISYTSAFYVQHSVTYLTCNKKRERRMDPPKVVFQCTQRHNMLQKDFCKNAMFQLFTFNACCQATFLSEIRPPVSNVESIGILYLQSAPMLSRQLSGNNYYLKFLK